MKRTVIFITITDFFGFENCWKHKYRTQENILHSLVVIHFNEENVHIIHLIGNKFNWKMTITTNNSNFFIGHFTVLKNKIKNI